MSQRPDLAPPTESATPRNPSGAPFVRPRWATAIGILSILYASLGLLFHLLDLGIMLLLRLVPQLEDSPPEARRFWEDFPPWLWRYVEMVDGSCLVLAAALLAGGILLLRCRRAARSLHLLGASGVLVTVAVGVGMVFLTEVFLTDWSEYSGLVWFIASVSVVRAAYPVFVLVWFLRKKVWNEVDGWVQGRRATPDAPQALPGPPPAVAAGRRASLLFPQGTRPPGWDVTASTEGLSARMGSEALEIPWDSITRLGFGETAVGQARLGVAHLEAEGDRRLAWTDPLLFGLGDMQTAAPPEQGRRVTWPDGAETPLLWPRHGVLLTAIVIEKAGLVEQGDGTFCRPGPGDETAPAPPHHAAPEDLAPSQSPRVKRTTQAVLLVLGLLAFSAMESVGFAVALIVAILVHEYGHVVAMKWSGVRVKGIFILPFVGGVALSEDEAPTAWQEFVICIMGPAFGGALALAAVIAAFLAGGQYPFLADVAMWWTGLNLFNLMPLGVLDGGRIVSTLAASTHRAVGIIASLGTALLSLLAAVLLESWLLGLVGLVAFAELFGRLRSEKCSEALAGLGCTAAGLRQAVAATWQRIGRIANPADPADQAKAKRLAASLDRFKGFFRGRIRPTRMRPGQIVGAAAIYAGAITFLLGLFLACVVAGNRQGDKWTTLNDEAASLHRQGRYDQAIVVAKKALEVAEQTEGPDHPDVATSLNNLAWMYYIQGRYAEAEPHFKRALAIREKALGPDHPDVAQSLENLAKLYRATDRAKEAEALEKRAAAIRAIKR